MFFDIFVYVGEVGVEVIDGIENCGLVGVVECFDGFGVEVFDSLFVIVVNVVFCIRIVVECVDCFGDVYL